MPILYRVDHDGRVVIAIGHGVLIDSDVFDYQRGVWSRADVVGFDELIDMTRVTRIALPSTNRARPDVSNLPATRREQHEGGRRLSHDGRSADLPGNQPFAGDAGGHLTAVHRHDFLLEP